MILRPYQTDAIANLRASIAEGNKRIVLAAPTGSGKSVMALAVVKSAVEKKRKVLFAVNRVQLVQQFSDHLQREKIEHGILRGEDSRREYLPVIVGSIQTVARRGLADTFDLIVIDEAHAAGGTVYYHKLLHAMPQAVVIGMTATPWSRGMARYHEELKGPLFQDVVVAAHYSQLIAEGSLVDCDVYAPVDPDLTGVKLVTNQFGERDYNEKQLGAAMNKPKLVGDIVEHWHRLAKGTRTVVFATSIAHSEAIVEEFKRHGVRAEHISCYTDHDERRRILKRSETGETTVVSCSALLREGWDNPAVTTAILARPTKSQIAFVQMVGRVLRPFPGKTKATLIDHSGSVMKLGFPTEDRTYELDDGKPKTTEEKKPAEDGGDEKTFKCPSCHFVHKKWIPVCDNCGFSFPRKPTVAVGDGVLGKVQKPKKLLPVDKQSLYSQLLHIQRERGYSDGWLAHKYKTKTGVWPRGLQPMPIKPTPEVMSWVRSQNIRYAKGSAKAQA